MIDVGLAAAALAAGDLVGPAAEQPQVARADRPARAGQQGQQRGVGGDVVEQVQGRDDLGDLGQPEQAGEADDLDRDAGAGERVEDVLGVRVVAGEDADRRPTDSVVRRARAPPSTRWSSSSACVSKTRSADRADVGLGLGDQRLDLAVLLVERRGQPVGDLEDAGVGAAVDGERVDRHRRRSRDGKVSAKLRMLDTEAPRQP